VEHLRNTGLGGVARVNGKAMAYEFTAKEADEGARLDQWLTKKLGGYSRKQVKSLLDGGRVLINGRRVLIAGWELEIEDRVEVRLPPGGKVPDGSGEKPAETGAQKRAARSKSSGSKVVSDSIERHLQRKKAKRRTPELDAKGNKVRKGRLKIYHEDRDIIVVEKPAGILAVPRYKPGGNKGGNKSRRDGTLGGEVRAYLKRKYPQAKNSFIAAMHRLDVETSGIMVFALSKTGERLTAQFRKHTIRREYTAIVSGRVEQANGVINMPLEKGKFHGGKKMRPTNDDSENLKAITEYRVNERYENATFLDVTLRTGRTHQIRVHFAEKGHPIIGDNIYGTCKTTLKMPFKRHALHAKTLGFSHPSGGKKMLFRSPMPDDMKALIDELRGS
jgi:23S rRNA pseudouridine1911/1915/1917 synthase